MYTWWAFVKNDQGGFMRVTVQAATSYDATQMLRSMYGSRMISEAASLQN